MGIDVDSDETFMKNLCKKYDVSYTLTRKLKTMIFPLLVEAHKRLKYRFDKAYVEQRKGTNIRLTNSAAIISMLGKISSKIFSMKERWIITLHLEYLALVEGFFTTQINFLVFTLIANGHDLYSTWKGKYVDKLNDIEGVNLAFKLKFLRRHGFGIIANKVNIKLRNSVAHLFYEIDRNGTVRFGKQKITKKEYDKLYDDLRNVSFGLHIVSLTYYRRFAQSPP